MVIVLEAWAIKMRRSSRVRKEPDRMINTEVEPPRPTKRSKKSAAKQKSPKAKAKSPKPKSPKKGAETKVASVKSGGGSKAKSVKSDSKTLGKGAFVTDLVSGSKESMVTAQIVVESCVS